MFNIDSDIKKSSTIDKKFYTKNEIYQQVINKIFAFSWQLTTDRATINKTNIIPFRFLEKSINEPMILVKDDGIKCLSNVCTHRAHLLEEKSCNKNKLKCRYHGRTFKLNGQLNHAPGFNNASNFPTKDDNLIQYHAQNWHQFIFISMNPKINISNALDDISNRLPHYKFSDLIFDKHNSNSYYIKANWALYCENYLEGFHVPFVHKGLTKDINYDSYETIIIDNSVIQIAEASIGEKTIKDTNNIYAYYYWIFPNLMINIYEWGVSINIVEPLSINRTKINFLSYPFKGRTQPVNTSSSLDNVEMEDQNVVLNVQKGIESNAYKGGRYSPDHEKGLHYFHLLINKYLNDIST
ncbi:MAG: choline monooxygenase [Candidatus Marinimicrobia bacterium]|nr:choline monooxygenase [Candidatus Neomarinimicrobiota bacterium]